MTRAESAAAAARVWAENARRPSVSDPAATDRDVLDQWSTAGAVPNNTLSRSFACDLLLRLWPAYKHQEAELADLKREAAPGGET